jgi:uncharacterized spore protein YtfJ
MELQKFIEGLGEKVSGKATVNTVFGEPVSVGEKKVITVARVAYGFGGGAGGGGNKQSETSKLPALAGEGGGGGGGIAAMPVGVVEITPQYTRFVRFGGTRRLFGAVAFGMALGAVLSHRRR